MDYFSTFALSSYFKKNNMTETNPITYPSKVDAWLVAVIVIGFAVAIIVALGSGTPWPWILAVFAPLILLMFVLLLTNRYTVDGDRLIVRDSLFHKKAYNIMDIVSITPTHNPLSAPAASLDRIAIRFKNHDEILLSPKGKDLFYDHLKKVNPNINSK